MNLRALAISALLATASFATSAAGANLITNGGFETGDFSGWTLSGNQTYTSVEKSIFDLTPHTGQYFAALGGDADHSYVSQTFTDTPGEQLLLTFFVESDGREPNLLDVSFTDGFFTDLSAIDSTNGKYDEYQYAVTGTGLDTLTFDSVDFATNLGLDDVSVTSISDVPEPQTWALMLAGAFGAGGGLRLARRRRTTLLPA